MNGCRRRLKFGRYSCGDVSLAGRVILCDGCRAAGSAIDTKQEDRSPTQAAERLPTPRAAASSPGGDLECSVPLARAAGPAPNHRGFELGGEA